MDFTIFDFIQMHSLGVLVSVIVAVAAAWVFAEKG